MQILFSGSLASMQKLLAAFALCLIRMRLTGVLYVLLLASPGLVASQPFCAFDYGRPDPRHCVYLSNHALHNTMVFPTTAERGFVARMKRAQPPNLLLPLIYWFRE